MKIYRTAVVGARRGVHHARAYRGLENMKVVAVCEVVEERLTKATQELGVTGYRDYAEMLEKEKPDIVHVVTVPTIPRALWVAPAAAAGVKALVLEKPLALRPVEADALRDEAAKHPSLRIIINHQRRYMPFADRLRELQASGALGDVHFIRASTQGEVMDMTTHLMDVVLLALGDASPMHIWATVEGSATYDVPHLRCPENLMATYTFSNGARAFFESARQAFGTRDFSGSNPRCNVDVWSERGRFWWRENGTWGYHLNGMAQPFVAPAQFNDDDMPAQTCFTQAIADWLDDESKPHHCRLELALLGFDAILFAYRSALLGCRVSCDTPLTDVEWEQLREKLCRT